MGRLSLSAEDRTRGGRRTGDNGRPIRTSRRHYPEDVQILTICRPSQGGDKRLAADRCVEHLHRVRETDGAAHAQSSRLDLEQTAWVGGHEHLGAGGEDMSRLAVAEVAGGV